VKRLIFWGAAGQARVLRELTRHFGYELVALFDNNPGIESPFCDVPLYHGIEGFKQWRGERSESGEAFLIAIGGDKGRDRVEIHRFLEANQLKPIVVVHPVAFVAATAQLGSGTQVLAHATVCADVSIGEECIINTASSVDHESKLGAGVHVGPGAVITGCVSVGDYSFIGARAVVLPRVNIGANVVVGAGSVVNKDVPDGMITFGNPIRVMHPIGARPPRVRE
jgi:sugar O-acyltransferase (sialic acid O-acetyltransferase NeuD family)